MNTHIILGVNSRMAFNGHYSSEGYPYLTENYKAAHALPEARALHLAKVFTRQGTPAIAIPRNDPSLLSSHI